VLEGESFTRRIPAVSLGRFGVITGVIEKSEKFREKFTGKITSEKERITSFPIVTANEVSIGGLSPSPVFSQMDVNVVGSGLRFMVRVLEQNGEEE